MLLRGLLSLLALLCVSSGTFAQTRWYKFEKDFTARHYASDSAFGELRVTQFRSAQNKHTVSCGGNDGELHLGVLETAVIRQGGGGGPISAPAGGAAGDFGLVVEPPNVTPDQLTMLKQLQPQRVGFRGYFRVWNEGHDVGPVHPSNPHHVLELHPMWVVRIGSQRVGSSSAVFPMPGYSGYGVSKYGPVLQSLVREQWLQVAEDDEFVFVQMRKAENFYQLPVEVKAVRSIANGKEAIVDVFSSGTFRRLVYADLTVIVVDGTLISDRMTPGTRIFLLGLFSVNLRKVLTAAAGHRGRENAVFAPRVLEFFAFGIPRQRAVASCSTH